MLSPKGGKGVSNMSITDLSTGDANSYLVKHGGMLIKF